jgi:phosphoglycerate dehydrogenase-like enzyme
MSEKVNILIIYDGLTESHIKKISEISDRIKIRRSKNRKNFNEFVKEVEIIFGWLDKEIFLAAKKIKWVQVPSAGVGFMLFHEIINSKVILTNSSGVHRIPISEMVMAMILGLAKRLNRYMESQLKAEWTFFSTEELAGKTLGVLGFGNIGMETAWKAKCFNMKVLALNTKPIRRPTYVDKVLGPDDLDYLLTGSDYLVVTVPLTKKTFHLISERELRLMKQSAYIINVSRGAVIDNKALIKSLKEGWISGAGLDVFEEEPLPSNSEFWKMKNVIVTPHMSGTTPHYYDRAVELFCENLNRYLKGKTLINIVNKKTGY